ncbi:MAG: hypothetical protein JNG83_04295 [Opitutaceae bacterium]|nr:hypothetical protein [Opitutaceae bacterium]
MHLLLLILELLSSLVVAWLVWRSLGAPAEGRIENLLGWGLAGFAVVAAIGTGLGAVGGLGPAGFAVAHAAALGPCLILRRSRLAEDARAWRALVADVWRALRSDRFTAGLSVLLAGFLAVTLLLAAAAEPVVYDALTYRLSRIGHWLQEGNTAHFPTNDPRQNYMPVVPDLVMTWLVSGTSAGFRGAALAQWAGGVLLLLATAGFGRQAGLGRPSALGASLLAAGAANVAPQFTTVHTDLVTAGVLAASLFLWESAARRGQGSGVAGLGGGLALGAKGTVFYLGPTLLLWAWWVGRTRRLPRVAWSVTLAAAALSAGVFAAPGFVRNLRSFGGPLGPPDFVAMHHQSSAGQLPGKLALNLATSAVQLFDPNSQPPGLRAAARAAGRSLAACLPTEDAFSYERLNRRETLRTIIDRAEPDADSTTFGLVLPLLFGLGALAACRPGARAGAPEIRRGAAGVVLFALFFHAMQQWHPYGFRYFILVTPWMAVVAAWGLQGWPQRLRRVGWFLAGSGAVATAWLVLADTHQAGWRAVVQPERSRGYYVYAHWREWSRTLGSAGDTLHLALPFNRPLAAFYRTGGQRLVQPVTESALAGTTAEAAVKAAGGGWLIVPAGRFLGAEGRVIGRTWLFAGDPASPFSLAAYRLPAEGEAAAAIVYRNLARTEAGVTRHEMLIRPDDEGRVRLRLESGAGEAWRCEVTTPAEVRRIEWAGGEAGLDLKLSPGLVSEVQVRLEPRTPATGGVGPRLSW